MKIERAKKLFHYINDHLFDGELDEPEFYIYSGKILDFDFEIDGVQVDGFIGINRDAEKFSTMIHEMIHLWQEENGKHRNHSGWFRVWCDKAYEEFYRQ